MAYVGDGWEPTGTGSYVADDYVVTPYSCRSAANVLCSG